MTRRDDKTVRYLQAGLGVILHYGYRKSTFEDVAGACGVSRGTLYKHFASKEALVREMIAWWLEETRAAQRAAVDPDAPPEERLLAVVEAVWRRLAPVRERTLGLLEGVGDALVVGSDLIAAWEAELQGTIRELLQEGIASGRFRPVDVEPMAAAFYLALKGVLGLWVFQPHVDASPQSCELLLRTLFAGLRAEEGPRG